MCTRKETGRVDVKKGHDDVLFGAMLANIAMRQYAPPRTLNPAKSFEKEEDDEVRSKMKVRGDAILDEGDPRQMAKRHIEKINRKIESFPQGEEEYADA
jgi:hypothetical protein